MDRDRDACPGLPLVLAARHHPGAAAPVHRDARRVRPGRSRRGGVSVSMEQERQGAPGSEALLSVAGLRREVGGVLAVDDAPLRPPPGAGTSPIRPYAAPKA